MMLLDVPTLIAMGAASAALVGIILPSARDSSEVAGFREATWAAWCLAAAFVCLATNGSRLPEFIPILGGNFLIWTGATGMYLSYRRFNDRAAEAPKVLGGLAVVGLVFAAVWWSGAEYVVRAVYTSMVLAAVMVASVWELARDQGLRRERSRAIGIGLSGLVAVCMIARIGVLIAQHSTDGNLLAPAFERTLAFFPSLLYTLGGGMGVLVMYRERSDGRSRQLALTDPMTGCANRRALEDRVRTELAWARQAKRPLSILVTDVDKFKRVNDEHGHAVGDAVIRHVAEVLKAGVRRSDLVARYGGEEFCVLLPQADAAHAAALAERLRQTLAGGPVPEVGLSITASFGVAGFAAADDESWEDLFRRADAALYAAKEGGRNRVVRAEDPNR
jgi:diguanylate cyclase (GGDEF)-like protein